MRRKAPPPVPSGGSSSDAPTPPPSSSEAVISRDLPQARHAFERGDVELSKAAHRAAASASSVGFECAGECAEPGHNPHGHSLRAHQFIGGGRAALASSLLFLSTGTASGLGSRDALRLGAPLVLAGVASAALMHWREAGASDVRYRRERAREAWELSNYPEGERREMVELFVARGCGAADAAAAIDAMSQHADFFVDVMMMEELGMLPPDPTPLRSALTAGAGGAVLGLLPFGAFGAALAALADEGGGGGGGGGGARGWDLPPTSSAPALLGAALLSALALGALELEFGPSGGDVVGPLGLTRKWTSGLRAVVHTAAICALGYGLGAAATSASSG